MVTSAARLSKLVSVTPKAESAAPTSVPTTPAPLKMLMSVAKRVPSMPGGHSAAASTSSGMKANWPSTVSTSESPKVNQ